MRAPTDDELRARLAPLMRPRTRFLEVERPAVVPLDELAPVTPDPTELALIAALTAEDPAGRSVYADWLEGHGQRARAAWLRAFPDGDTLIATRFGGQPAALRGERWPICQCGDPLRFVGQIAGADAAEPTWYGLVTVFFCWSCCRYGEQDCGGAERPWQSWCLRAYPVAELEAFVKLALPDLGFLGLPPDGVPEAEFVFHEGFVQPVRELCLPHHESLTTTIPATADLFADLSHGERWALIQRIDHLAYEMTGRPGHGERANPMPRNAGLAIGGYPYWYNGPDVTPACGSCGQPMTLLLQIDPHGAVGAGWGDVGTLFIFSCAQHHDWFGLRMQCT